MLDQVVRLQPRSVLDVGPGYGKYGFLVREALDFAVGRLDRPSWQVRIDGIDAFPYKSPLLAWVYDAITVADIAIVAADLPPYDLVILGDVIEHLDKQTGIQLIDNLLAKSRNVLLSTPREFFQQEIADNPFETHRSLWSLNDFGRWAFDAELAGGAAWVVLLRGRGAERPTDVDSSINSLVYGLPFVGRRPIAVRALKTALQRAISVRPRRVWGAPRQ